MTTRLTVLYIMGLWRSGSTVLDITLGAHPDVQGTGELRNLPFGSLHGYRCSCGELLTDCPFWIAVMDRWGGDPERLVTLQDDIERMRSLPKLALGRVRGLDEYGAQLSRLYGAIASVSGTTVVVDSSKYPGRALALAKAGMDVRIIHLVRDGRAVTWSWRRLPNVDKEGKTLEVDSADIARRVAQHWLRMNLVSSAVRRLAAPSIRVRYEDFTARPAAELERIGALADVDFTPVIGQLTEGIEIGHMAAGNRVMSKNRVTLNADNTWKDRLSARDRRTFWRRAGWLASRYGYESAG